MDLPPGDVSCRSASWGSLLVLGAYLLGIHPGNLPHGDLSPDLPTADLPPPGGWTLEPLQNLNQPSA